MRIDRLTRALFFLVFSWFVFNSPVLGQKGSWNLIKIEGESHFLLLPSDSKELPLDTRIRKGVGIAYTDPETQDRRNINMDVAFDYIKEEYPDDGSLNHAFGVAVTARLAGSGWHYTAILCKTTLTTASGHEIDAFLGKHPTIHVDLNGSKNFDCSDLFPVSEFPKNEDFKVAIKLLIDDKYNFTSSKYNPRSGDITYAFTYRWTPRGGKVGTETREDNMSLLGKNLTYYPRATFEACRSDCARNGSCKGFTWIKAGTYNPNDSAMCYLLSEVTGRSPAKGHHSGVRP